MEDSMSLSLVSCEIVMNELDDIKADWCLEYLGHLNLSDDIFGVVLSENTDLRPSCHFLP